MEEAIELGIKELDAQRDEVEVTVLSKGKSGILGLGAEPARVRVSLIAKGLETAQQARQLLETIITHLGVSASVSLKSSQPASDDEREGLILTFDIEGDDAGLLIGRRGDTLGSLQFLANSILHRTAQGKASVVLDVEHYRERRQNSLQSMARRMAERAATTGRPITLEPMPPAERRAIHLALANHPKVTTQSTGEGGFRKVVITPKRRVPRDREQRAPREGREYPSYREHSQDVDSPSV
ncbi:MAG: protein jag [Chloroflexi bacterium]|nr:protein jag [Chloroflexota bacterium]